MGTAFFLRAKQLGIGASLTIMMVALSACQPPTDAQNSSFEADAPRAESETAPIVIGDNTVTMSADDILNIKPSRYQPSLGLQGITEAIKQSKFRAVQDVTLAQVLVTEGQWVEKGAPLLILKQNPKPAPTSEANDASETDESSNAEQLEPSDDQPKTKDQTATANTDNQSQKETSNTSSKAPTKPALEHVAIDDKKDPAEADTKGLITVHASFSGRIDSLPKQTGAEITKGTPLLTMSDDTDLRFIATLPLQAKPQLSVGQTVNFTAKEQSDTFTGQISQLIAGSQPDELLVYVHVINNEASRNKLSANTAVSGRVNYGQIDVGAIVPERGIHDTDLSALKSPPYQPLTPLKANVWIIKQDQRLTRQPVEVIEYNPTTGQYLIAGISNDSLICLADLPVESAGKKVVVS